MNFNNETQKENLHPVVQIQIIFVLWLLNPTVLFHYSILPTYLLCKVNIHLALIQNQILQKLLQVALNIAAPHLIFILYILYFLSLIFRDVNCDATLSYQLYHYPKPKATNRGQQGVRGNNYRVPRKSRSNISSINQLANNMHRIHLETC